LLSIQDRRRVPIAIRDNIPMHAHVVKKVLAGYAGGFEAYAQGEAEKLRKAVRDFAPPPTALEVLRIIHTATKVDPTFRDNYRAETKLLMEKPWRLEEEDEEPDSEEEEEGSDC
jgi:hypothetical protein